MARSFWPEGARLVLTISLMFESGAEVWPDSHYLGPLGDIKPGYRDLPGETYFEYGYKEAIPRLLDLFDRHDIKSSVFAVGKAVENSFELTKEIANRGHELAAHGVTWVPQYTFDEEQEREFIHRSVEIVSSASGVNPVGWNCWGLRRTPRTLDLLQAEGFTYHIDDVSRDEPFVQTLASGKPFVTVPYTLHNNDLLCYEALGYSTSAYLDQLKDEFDWLYEEAAGRRRMMAIPCHDRTMGRPTRMKAFDAFIRYAKSHEGVVFLRRDQIAQYMLDEWNAGNAAEA